MPVLIQYIGLPVYVEFHFRVLEGFRIAIPRGVGSDEEPKKTYKTPTLDLDGI